MTELTEELTEDRMLVRWWQSCLDHCKATYMESGSPSYKRAYAMYFWPSNGVLRSIVYEDCLYHRDRK